jgi:hypothetical protein
LDVDLPSGEDHILITSGVNRTWGRPSSRRWAVRCFCIRSLASTRRAGPHLALADFLMRRLDDTDALHQK